MMRLKQYKNMQSKLYHNCSSFPSIWISFTHVLVISYFFITSAFAATDLTQHIIIIDAGSSKTRLHAYAYSKPESGVVPEIIEVYSDKEDIPLSKYLDVQDKAKKSYHDLFKRASKEVPNNTPVYILATAGMRLLDKTSQDLTYEIIKQQITDTDKLLPKFIGTISGEDEGVFGWLSVNYLLGNFHRQAATVGVLDLGGASSEITFSLNDASLATKRILLGNKLYFVYSQSVLGIGVDQTRKVVNPATCYPEGTPISQNKVGHFNFDACTKQLDAFVDSKKMLDATPNTKGMKFVAISAYFFIMDFFNVLQNPKNLAQASQEACQASWPEFRAKYPKVPEKYLLTNCLTGVYINSLLQSGYTKLLAHATVEPLNEINKKAISWTMGAALYEITHQSCINY